MKPSWSRNELNYFEAKIEDKFRVLFEMSKILDKKLAKVLEKVAEVDRKVTEIIVPPSAGPSEGPMATNHEYVKELERQIREYKLMVEKNNRIIKSVCGP
jgi:hypothetical protein